MHAYLDLRVSGSMPQDSLRCELQFSWINTIDASQLSGNVKLRFFKKSIAVFLVVELPLRFRT